ncbi:myotubularin-related protein 2-like [Hydractinia symbiolongicarpus]|uniref:myotubularin-related protein 2-like n=1 Tax=Hydractinia symbiolongicarpus TaxID=13093 RepID=UPI00254EE7F8|nr:myotubularin-related protein 2-like [Hydractinia symbiolongicarpus]XP_057314879.1 myotubularin-related protein 2-like [Hydractinia symbiolongicarpus]
MTKETDVDTGVSNEDSPDEQDSEEERPGSSPSSSADVPLFGGEKVVATAYDVTYLCPYTGRIVGTLYITNYKLHFVSSEDNGAYTVNSPLGNLNKIEKVGSSAKQKQDSVYGLEMLCKDMRNLKFALKHENNPRRKIFDAIQNYAFPISNGRSYFAFEYQEEFRMNGWEIYDAAKEMSRMGLPTDCWRITELNKDYRLCDTYPAVLAVPSSIGDDEVQKCATFRSKSRLPVLSWLHPLNNASITRCSQPNIGVAGVRRNKDDEKFVQAILEANLQCHKLFIMDARPKINAVANQAKGGGYEDMDNYPNTELVFLDIANIHVMRDSLRKLKDMVYPEVDDAHFLSNLESTRWLEYIKAVIAGAVRIADTVDRCRTSCIVHCSDGWDRTPQLTSLAMLLLDPYYRTLSGFEILIEKEWCSFGHKFSQRCGLGDKNYSDDQRSPIFIQFIDAVWQVTKQFPCAFEFNEHFLVTILLHLNSCLFGTFLYNSETDRVKENVKGKTHSLWSYINDNLEDYLNPLYAKLLHQHVLLPVASVRHLKLWKSLYMRWNPRMQPQESMETINKLLFTRVQQLRSMCEKLQSELDARAKVEVEVSPANESNSPNWSSSSAVTPV